MNARNIIIAGLAIALLAALGTAGIERTRRAGVVAKFAEFRAEVAQQETTRSRVALDDSNEVRRLVVRHATQQQGVLHAHYARVLAQAADDRERADAGRSLHDAAAEFTASRRGGETESDSASCRLARADVVRLTGLLTEGADLVSEGDRLLQVTAGRAVLWHGIATNDRALTPP